MQERTRQKSSGKARGEDLSSHRRCLVCGEEQLKRHLIRFVVGPESCVVPDVDGSLPGRGLWVKADRAVLAQAISKKMFARAAKAQVKPCDTLLDMTEKLLARRCLSLLGLARGAGLVVTGQPQIEHALAKGELSYILLAQDAGRDCRKKLSAARLASSGFSRTELGEALGYEHLASVGVRSHPLAIKLEEECARWQGVRAVDEMNNDCINDQELDSDGHD